MATGDVRVAGGLLPEAAPETRIFCGLLATGTEGGAGVGDLLQDGLGLVAAESLNLLLGVSIAHAGGLGDLWCFEANAAPAAGGGSSCTAVARTRGCGCH